MKTIVTLVMTVLIAAVGWLAAGQWGVQDELTLIASKSWDGIVWIAEHLDDAGRALRDGWTSRPGA